jgi:hypothetical protein
MRMARATVGPWEAKRQLAFVNRRHERGRFVAALRAELIADLGGDPPAAKRLLVDMVTYAALQVSRLVTPYLARGEELTSAQLEDLAKWQREVRDTLRVLGIERVEQAPPALADLLAEKRKAAA